MGGRGVSPFTRILYNYNMNEAQKQLFLTRVEEVLLYIWDPIGIRDTPEARDEYDSYADQVWRMALNDESKKAISDYLTNVVADRMGIAERKDSDDEVTDIILDWKDYFEDPERVG
jgi:hypothetical protein